MTLWNFYNSQEKFLDTNLNELTFHLNVKHLSTLHVHLYCTSSELLGAHEKASVHELEKSNFVQKSLILAEN